MTDLTERLPFSLDRVEVGRGYAGVTVVAVMPDPDLTGSALDRSNLEAMLADSRMDVVWYRHWGYRRNAVVVTESGGAAAEWLDRWEATGGVLDEERMCEIEYEELRGEFDDEMSRVCEQCYDADFADELWREVLDSQATSAYGACEAYEKRWCRHSEW